MLERVHSYRARSSSRRTILLLIFIAPLIKQHHEAICFGRGLGELKRSDEAPGHLAGPSIAISQRGSRALLGAVVSRGEGLVMRLACLYAIQDMSYVVRPLHLTASLHSAERGIIPVREVAPFLSLSRGSVQ